MLLTEARIYCIYLSIDGSAPNIIDYIGKKYMRAILANIHNI